MDVLALLISLGCPPSGAALYAPHIAYLAPRMGIETDQASAVLVSEGHCNPFARSRGGDVSAWQLRPGAATLGKHTYSEEQLRRPSISTWLALRWMAYGRAKCGPGLLMLGWYGSGKCSGGKKYARRVMARIARAQRQLAMGAP